MKIFIIAVYAICIFSGCSYLNNQVGLEDDNFIEEIMEDIVEQKICLPEGYLDFTPECYVL